VLSGQKFRHAILWPLLLACSAAAQEPPKSATAARTPAQIALIGSDCSIPLADPVIIRVLASLPETHDSAEVPIPEKLAVARNPGRPADSVEVRSVLESATQLCRRFIKLDLPSPESTFVLTHDSEDVLVSQGSFQDNAAGISRYLLWDDPVSTSLMMQVSPSILKAPVLLEALLKGMLAWGEGNLQSVGINWSASVPQGAEILRGSSHFCILRQMAVRPELTAAGYADGPEGWLAITFEKDLLGGADSEMVDIPERFPPLRTRILDWSTQALITATGHNGRGYSAYGRDRILLQELLRRPDLSINDFRDLVLRDVGAGPSARWGLPEPIQVAIQSSSGARFAASILEYFEGLRAKRSPVAESEAGQLVYRLVHDARPEFCDLVSGLANGGLAISESRVYTEKFCKRH
jgi:hypothetical protein